MPKEDISKFMVALRKAKEEAFLEGLYSRHASSSSRLPGGADSASTSAQVNAKVVNRGVVIVLDEDEEGLEVQKQKEDKLDEDAARTRENREVIPPQPKMKTPCQSSTSGTNLPEVGITHDNSKNALESQRKEIELLKRRVETAESNFVALVGRVQDFRTSLRSEIRSMPNGIESDGLSRLSTAMETTIDDAGLYLRNISDGLKQSRSNWEIRCDLGALTEKAGKGKRKAGDLSDDDNGQKPARVRPRPLPQRTGEFFDKPCSRCATMKKKCEKQKNGGPCVECKSKKQGCEYSQLRVKKNKETAEI